MRQRSDRPGRPRMLRLMWSIVKLCLFAIVVLAAGNLVHWRGRTLSDQVRFGLSQAEHSIAPALTIPDLKKLGAPGSLFRKPLQESSDAGSDEVAPSERQKLRALIRELNRSRSPD